MEPKYPHIKAKLVGQDDNAFNLLGIVLREMRRGGVTETEIKAFLEEAMSGTYDNLLITCMKWVNIK